MHQNTESGSGEGMMALGQLCFWSEGGSLSGRKTWLLSPGVRTAGVGGQEIRAEGLRHKGTEGRL